MPRAAACCVAWLPLPSGVSAAGDPEPLYDCLCQLKRQQAGTQDFSQSAASTQAKQRGMKDHMGALHWTHASRHRKVMVLCLHGSAYTPTVTKEKQKEIFF